MDAGELRLAGKPVSAWYGTDFAGEYSFSVALDFPLMLIYRLHLSNRRRCDSALRILGAIAFVDKVKAANTEGNDQAAENGGNPQRNPQVAP